MAAEHSTFPSLTPAIITKVHIDPSKIHPFGNLPSHAHPSSPMAYGTF